MHRLTTADRLMGGGAVIALLATYLTWFSYDAAQTTISVNGLRASVIGSIFFVATAIIFAVVAARAHWVRLPVGVDTDRVLKIATAVALGAVGLQLLLALDSGLSFHKGFGLAAICAIAMLVGSRRQGTSSNRI